MVAETLVVAMVMLMAMWWSLESEEVSEDAATVPLAQSVMSWAPQSGYDYGLASPSSARARLAAWLER